MNVTNYIHTRGWSAFDTTATLFSFLLNLLSDKILSPTAGGRLFHPVGAGRNRVRAFGYVPLGRILSSCTCTGAAPSMYSHKLNGRCTCYRIVLTTELMTNSESLLSSTSHAHLMTITAIAIKLNRIICLP